MLSGRQHFFNKWKLTRDPQRKKQLVEQAMADSNHAIQLNPQYANAYFARGLTHWVNKEYDPALADLGQAIQLNNKDARAYTYQGEVYGNRFMNAQALHLSGAGSCLPPGMGPRHRRLYRSDTPPAEQGPGSGLSRSRPLSAQRVRPGHRGFHAGLAVNPKDVRAYNNRGSSYYFQKRYEPALADFNEAIRLNPRVANPYNHRGQVYAALKEPEKAIQDLQQALRLNAQYADAYSSLAWLWATYPDAQVRDGKKAAEYATRAGELDFLERPGCRTHPGRGVCRDRRFRPGRSPATAGPGYGRMDRRRTAGRTAPPAALPGPQGLSSGVAGERTARILANAATRT